jgi:beta-phosphoglucomutase-like phosphatase (HAD superfamily)
MIGIGDVDAVIFDTDGVVTDTARLHAAAWKTVFDSFLRGWSTVFGERYEPFDVHADYLRYVDGKPRRDGVRDFLAARGVHADDLVVEEIVRRKGSLYLDRIRHGGVSAFPRG